LSFYYNELDTVLPVSTKKNSVLGLYLLYLLSQNKISEFHSVLQSIPTADHADLYINVPVSLEQHFVDGNYSKVLATKNVPLEDYNFFINRFINTVRSEIAKSAKVAYSKLTVKDACEIFMLNSVDELKEFVSNEPNMSVENGKVVFAVDQNANDQNAIPAVKMMYQVLDYALELEKIV
jgi:26S proteasome regulatory subunit N12